MLLQKLQSTGSDHLVLDVSDKDFTERDWSRIGRFLCNRAGSFGADGIGVLNRRSDHFDRMNLLAVTPDGNFPSLCINAALCSAAFADLNNPDCSQVELINQRNRYSTNSIALDETEIRKVTFGSFFAREVDPQELFRISLQDIRSIFAETGLAEAELRFFDIGTPQIHFGATEIVESQLQTLAERLGTVQAARDGINVTAVGLAHGKVLARTFERGGGGLTQSCASASSCAAIFAGKQHGSSRPISVVTKGGPFEIEITRTAPREFSAKIQGLVSPVYKVEIDLDLVANAKSEPQTLTTAKKTAFPDAILRHEELRTETLASSGFNDWCTSK